MTAQAIEASLIEGLFSASSCTAEGEPRLADSELYPEERAHVARAVPKRRAEFATARILCRQALAALGEAPVALVPRSNRAPVWPHGVVGSISHTKDYCAVVVNRASRVRSVGLDVENLRTLDAELFASILTPREAASLRARPVSVQNDVALLHFSAKEAFYKCQYPLTSGFLDFLDVELDVDLDAGTFLARVLKPGWRTDVSALAGRFRFRAGKVLCGVELGAAVDAAASE